MAGPILRMPAAPRRKPGLVFLVLFAMPMLAWIGYNWWDQPLDPDAAAVLEAKPEAVPDAENLFLALLAFPIAGEEPAYERGAAALAAHAQAVAKGGDPAQTYAQALDRPFAMFDEQGVTLCSAGNREGAYSCLRNSRAQREALGPLVLRMSPLLMRYRELEAYPRYSDPRGAATAVPPDSTALRVALLNLSIVALAAEEGAIGPATQALAQSATLWRRVLAAHDVALIDKLIASRAYSAHLLLASELIRDLPELRDESLAAVESILRPLDETERSLAGALAMEFRAQAQMWGEVTDPSNPDLRRKLPDADSWWYRLMVKRNDSTHRSYEDLQDLLALEREGCIAVAEQARKLAAQAPSSGSGLSWYEWFYNPMGRVLHASTNASRMNVEYLGRQCNLAALQGMVGLQLELKRRGVSAANIGAQVKRLADRYRDPNTGKAYAYDPQAQTLGFSFVGRSQEFTTPLPLVAP